MPCFRQEERKQLILKKSFRDTLALTECGPIFRTYDWRLARQECSDSRIFTIPSPSWMSMDKQLAVVKQE